MHNINIKSMQTVPFKCKEKTTAEINEYYLHHMRFVIKK